MRKSVTPQEKLIQELEEEYAWVPIMAPPEAKKWTLIQIEAYFEDGVLPEQTKEEEKKSPALQKSNDEVHVMIM